jgi:hypothetical protein
VPLFLWEKDKKEEGVLKEVYYNHTGDVEDILIFSQVGELNN